MLLFTPSYEEVKPADFSKLETAKEYKNRLFKMKLDIQDMIDMTNLKIRNLTEDSSNWTSSTIYYDDLADDIGWYRYISDMQKEIVSSESANHCLKITADDGGYILVRLLKKEDTNVKEVFRSPVACILTPIQDIVRDVMLSIRIGLDTVDEDLRDGCNIILKDKCHHVSTIYLGIIESRKKLANYQVALYCISLSEETKQIISEYQAAITMLDRSLERLDFLYKDAVTTWLNEEYVDE